MHKRQYIWVIEPHRQFLIIYTSLYLSVKYMAFPSNYQLQDNPVISLSLLWKSKAWRNIQGHMPLIFTRIFLSFLIYIKEYHMDDFKVRIPLSEEIKRKELEICCSCNHLTAGSHEVALDMMYFSFVHWKYSGSLAFSWIGTLGPCPLTLIYH